LDTPVLLYPTDELRIPEWFKELPFDSEAMEETIIDNKLDNLIGVLDYDLESTKQKQPSIHYLIGVDK